MSNNYNKNNINGKNSSMTINPILIFILIGLVVIFMLLINYIFTLDYSKNTTTTATATKISKKEFEQPAHVENNKNTIDIVHVLRENAGEIRIQEIKVEEQEIKFTTTYKVNDKLAKNETKVIRQGKNGKKEVSIKKVFEGDNLIEEDIITNHIIKQPVERIIETGASDFLAFHKVHIGDFMYLKGTSSLLKTPKQNSQPLTTIKQFSEVKLLDISGEWCKVSFGNYLRICEFRYINICKCYS